MADIKSEVGPLKILHAHSGFNLGGKEARAVRLMNIWGRRARHTILSAQTGAFGAAKEIAPDIDVAFPEHAPSLQGLPGVKRYYALARYMQQFDLVLTYNWGSMDVVGAHRLFSPFMRLPALIHHEDGFNEDEAERLNPKRNWYRRLMLGSAYALVVPSVRLENIARNVWHQTKRVRRISNGIDVASYAGEREDSAIPGFRRSSGKVIVGTVAGLRAVKNIPRLVRAVAPIKERVQLVIVGEGPERRVIEQEAQLCGLDDLCMAGFLPNPASYIGVFDIFALSSDSEQFPISLIEAMAAGVPAVATDVGDVRSMVADSNLPYIIPIDDESRFTTALGTLAEDRALANNVGNDNRAKAANLFDERQMVRSYAALYGAAAGRPNRLTD